MASRIIETFVESYAFAGKKRIAFATSGGSGMGKTVSELKNICPDADWKEGKMLNSISDKELADWAGTF